MTDDTILPFSFPAVQAKKVTAAFDGGRLTSNGGVMLLAMAERRLGLADNLARVFPDRRDIRPQMIEVVGVPRSRSRSRTCSCIQVGLRTAAGPPVAICVRNRRCRGWSVNRRWIGTPYRHPKGTPLSGEFGRKRSQRRSWPGLRRRCERGLFD